MAQIYQLSWSKNKKKSNDKKKVAKRTRHGASYEVEEARDRRKKNSYTYFGFDASLI